MGVVMPITARSFCASSCASSRAGVVFQVNMFGVMESLLLVANLKWRRRESLVHVRPKS